MSVIGFDIGNESCVITVAQRGGVDVLLNDESKCETPSVVTFGEKQRFLGSEGAASADGNPKSTISQIKRLIGKLYKEVEEDLNLLPFATSEGPRGGILIELEFLKKKWSFTPVEILGMLFKHLKQIAEKNLESAVIDCVIGIPSYFTDLQRRMYIDAAHIAGLKPLSLLHDGTAIALGYGLFNTDFSNSGPIYVMFVDIGHCDTQVTVAAFERGKMEILSHSFDPNLGGRDFDEVLFKHFAAQFKKTHKINVYSNARASVRLRAACEKVKKVLSSNADAPLSIECLIGDTDVRGFITREEFENLSSSLLQRVIVTCSMALADSALSVYKISTIELVGSGSRIPAITRYLTAVFGKEPTTTLNACECVARGCALRCAMLSPALKVRDYEIKDSFPYAIVILSEPGEVVLFQNGDPFPNEKILDHVKKIPFYLQVAYKNKKGFPAGISHIVGNFGIGSSGYSDAAQVTVKFKVKLNHSGIVELDSANIVDSIVGSNGWRMGITKEILNLPATENLYFSTTSEELHEAQEKEKMLAEQYKKVEEFAEQEKMLADQRNTLKSFIYDIRSKLSGAYQIFATDSEKEELTSNLQKTEDWLYEDSNDRSEQDYAGRLKYLKKLLEPIESKYIEEKARENVTKALQVWIAKYQLHADSLPADTKEKLEMSLTGFDIGNKSCVIAVAKHGGVDVLLNNESKRVTPAVVTFGEKQRFLGSEGAASADGNPKSTISQIKRLIGKQYKEVEEELKLLPLVTREGPRGGILIELEYLKKNWSFTPVEILGMLFKHLKQITEKNLESAVVDCVIGIPSYFTDLQRRMYLDAAHIAGLKPLSLMHDGTAIALGYGLSKTDFSNSGPTNVMFVDIGHCDTQVTVAAFEQGKMEIMSHSFDPNLGGRDFDEVLFKHFAAQFNEKYKINVYSNVRASVRIRGSCEKLKEDMMNNAEAPLGIECLFQDQNLRGFITREEFEKLSSGLLKRVIVTCTMALVDSGLSVDKISTIELVGSGSRIPAITRHLTSYFEKEPMRSLNASEWVARGCALRCAMLSLGHIACDYQIKDSFPYSIVIPSEQGEIVLFENGGPFPNEKILDRSSKIPFYLPVAYSKKKGFPAGVSHIVGNFGIGSSESFEKVKVKFRVKLNHHGIVELDAAKILGSQGWEMVAGKQTLNLPVTGNVDFTARDELHEAQEKEKMLAEQDKKVVESKYQRNTLESFVDDTRSKLSGAYQSFATDSEKEVIINNLQETEDLLYDDSDDDSEQDYTGRLKDLRKLIEPVESRYEEDARVKATIAMQTCIAKYQLHADSLPADQKEKIKYACFEARQWLDSHSPKALSTHIYHNLEVFESNCESIIRSKSSISRHEEPMDSEQRDQTTELDQKDQLVDDKNARIKAAKALETCIAKYRSHGESLPADIKEKVENACNEAEGWLIYVNAVLKNDSLKITLTDITNFTENFESECKSVIIPKPK